jgi:hypothetical protein
MEIQPLKLTLKTVDQYEDWIHELITESDQLAEQGNESMAVKKLTMANLLANAVTDFYNQQESFDNLPNCS